MEVGITTLLLLALIGTTSPSDSASGEGRALREMLLARGNLREARVGGLTFQEALTRELSTISRGWRDAPRAPKQVGLGAWLRTAAQPSNASRQSAALAPPEPEPEPELQSALQGTGRNAVQRDAAGEKDEGEDENGDEGLESLVAVLPESGLSKSELRTLLQRNGGDISAAVNHFLDAQAAGTKPVLAAPSPSEWLYDRCHLQHWDGCGSYAVSKWEEAWPKALGTRHVKGYLTRSLRQGVLPSGTQLKLWRPVHASPQGKSTAAGSASKSLHNRLIRFCAEARIPGEEGPKARWETCEGRLASDVARILAPLMDAGIISLQGRVCSAAPPLSFTGGKPTLFQDIFLDIDICLLPAALGQPVDLDAFGELLALLGAQQLQAASALQPNVSMHSPAGSAQPLSDGEGDFEKHACGAEGAPFVAAGQKWDGLKSTLKDFQRQGFAWMSARERLEHAHGAGSGQGEEGGALHPLWSLWHLPVHCSNKASANDTDVSNGSNSCGAAIDSPEEDGAVAGAATAEAGTSMGQRDTRLVKPLYVKATEGVLMLTPPRACRRVRGGILADEMGLGKTVQMLALIAADAHVSSADMVDVCVGDEDKREEGLRRDDDEGDRAGETWVRGEGTDWNGQEQSGGGSDGGCLASAATLVVCPTSILQQWAAEARRHVRWAEEEGSVVVYHGSQRAGELKQSILSSARIILTSYGVVAAEFASRRRRCAPCVLFDVQWRRVVLDEAHLIKSHTALSSRAVVALRSSRRWAITGTPLHNSCDDVLALLKFLHADPWADTSWWNRAIARPLLEHPRNTTVLALLRSILSGGRSPLMLRRLALGPRALPAPRSPQIEGVGLDLPEKKVIVEEVEFTEEERGVYDSVFASSKLKFDQLVTGGALLSNYACVLEILLRLRQACVHPSLLRGKDSGNFDSLTSHLLQGAERERGRGTGEAYVVDVMARAQSGQLDDCAVCLEPVADPVVTPCAHVFCRSCLFQLVTHRSGSTSLPLGARSRRRKRARVGGATDSSTTRCPTCRSSFEASEVRAIPRTASFLDQVRDQWRPSSKVTALVRDLLELQRADARRHAGTDIRNDTRHEAGTATQTGAGGLVAEEKERGGKSVVFSQWTSLLDVLQVALDQAGISYVRLDGSMTTSQRSEALRRLQGQPTTCSTPSSAASSILDYAKPIDATARPEQNAARSAASGPCVIRNPDGADPAVILMSLKAGGLGLNLVCCSNVFILDPWWNPQMEEQAIARVHRIGQSRKVFVKRYIVKDTVEENILRLQERKQLLCQRALGEISIDSDSALADVHSHALGSLEPNPGRGGAPVELLGQIFSRSR